MVHSKDQLVCLVGTGQHNAIIRDKWLKEGKKEIPWALAFGVPPAASLVASMPVPEGVSESEYVGAVVGKPLDVVKCELSELLVPANSEIVMEGTFSLTEQAQEGPFGDYLGLVFDDEGRMNPVFTVKAITHRHDAILPVSCPGRITDESVSLPLFVFLSFAQILMERLAHDSRPCSARASAALQRTWLSSHGSLCTTETMATWCALQVDTDKMREMKTTSEEFCRKLGNLAFRNKSCMLFNRILIFGEDVDIYDFKNIMWAFVTRCRPGQDEYVFDDVPSFPLTPYMSYGRGDPRKGGKVILDCLLAHEYKEPRKYTHVDFEHSYPEELKRKVKANWKGMGFTAQ